MSAEAILSREVLQAINLPTDRAISLPREAYTDPAFFGLESRFVFEKSWVFVGPASSIPDPGDAFPIDVVGKPVVLVRQRDGTIKAFHNVCRHRGMILVDAPVKNRPTLVCPYHAWSYAPDGRLVRAPHFSGPDNHEMGSIDPACMGLVPVRADTWHDWIFVNLSGDGVTLQEHVAPLAERYREFDFSLLRQEGSAEFDLAANWKLPIENFREGYHLPWTHKFLNSISSLEAHYSVVEDRFAGQGSTHYDGAAAGYGALPLRPNISEHWHMRAEYPSMLPNLWLGIHSTHVNVWGIFPVGPHRTIEKVFSYFWGDDAMRPDCKEARALVVSNVRKTNLEDVGVIEGMQRGRASPGYVAPRFSAYHEATLHQMQKSIANTIAAGLRAAA